MRTKEWRAYGPATQVRPKALFYSLSVGSALGANTSLMGATNNMVTAGIVERAGYPITYREFLIEEIFSKQDRERDDNVSLSRVAQKPH